LVKCKQLDRATFVHVKMLNLTFKSSQPSLQAFTLLKIW